MKRLGRGDDSGVAAIFVLVFVAIFAVFSYAAVQKSYTATVSGERVAERGQLNYALDAGASRALQILKSDLATGTPTKCVDTAAGNDPLSATTENAGGLVVKTAHVAYSCTTVAGKAGSTGSGVNSNYALVVTSTAGDALTTQSGISHDLLLGGSVFLESQVTDNDVKKAIEVSGGNIVQDANGNASCDTQLAGLNQLYLSTTTTGYLKACTDQTLADAEGVASLGAAPTVNQSLLLGTGTDVVLAGKHCRVFFPGLYTAAPSIDQHGSNYFVSGAYYLKNIGAWTIQNGADIIGGQRVSTGDTAVPSGDCAAMTDAVALSKLPAATQTIVSPLLGSQGNMWVLGGNTTISVAGQITLFTPTASSGQPAFNFYDVQAADHTSDSNWVTATSGLFALNTQSATSGIEFNAKIYMPQSKIALFASNPTTAVARAGVVVQSIDLGASAAADGFAISAPTSSPTPAAPFRTVKVVATDATGASNATTEVIATVGNYSPYAVEVKSWRTGTDGH
ncbi:MAG: hypothetical protein QOD07_2631 [Frankiaceae bacterium]|jgi:hypothetical protein|nr:hypothetical protein [Frankiaceae bacterium]